MPLTEFVVRKGFGFHSDKRAFNKIKKKGKTLRGGVR